MKSYTAQVEVTTRRTITVIAPNRAAGQRAVAARFGDKPGRIIQLCEASTPADVAAAGRVARQVLLDAEFLDIDGAPASIGDWVRAFQVTPHLRQTLSSTMAPAGLRVLPDGIAVANNPVILFLADIYANTKWHGGQWGRAMGLIPGASRANLTFAGIRSRAVIVPLPANLAKQELIQ